MNLSNPQLHQYFQSISPLNRSDYDAFLSLLDNEALKKGEYFAQQGRIEKKFGVLTSGVVRTFFRSDNGEEHIKSFGTAFSFIGGFSSLVSGKENKINVQAIIDSTILTAPYAAVVKLFSEHAQIETFARRLVESLFINKEAREIELLSLPAEKRYLLFRNQYPQLEAKIPQYHIASYLGITPTQLSRIRRKLFNG